MHIGAQQWPLEISALLTEFAEVFEHLVDMPPARHCDHMIPLVTGARLVHIRPYRYPPQLKTEIDTQVADMLAKGII